MSNLILKTSQLNFSLIFYILQNIQSNIIIIPILKTSSFFQIFFIISFKLLYTLINITIKIHNLSFLI